MSGRAQAPLPTWRSWCGSSDGLMPQRRPRAQEQQAHRYLDTYWDTDGMLVVRGRLPPEQGALLLKALEAGGAEGWLIGDIVEGPPGGIEVL